MIKEVDIDIPVTSVADMDYYKTCAAAAAGIRRETINNMHILRRSFDARGKKVVFHTKISLYTGSSYYTPTNIFDTYKDVRNAPPVIIVGAGPAGLFAALKLLSAGLKPIILDRGKDVGKRKIDIANLYKTGNINNNSNYCYGEGGAGTFSDGKLFTRSTKRGNIDDVLQTFVAHGADENILIDTHAHIGSDKLPQIIKNIRNTIITHGGNYYFDTCVNDVLLDDDKIIGVSDINGTKYEGIAVILATGHSAKDIFQMLNRHNIILEVKDFAIGVRLEHPRELINKIQYHSNADIQGIPTASYNVVTQIDGKGVFSFCMCPGGMIVPSMTENGSLVVNGMSNSKRNMPFSNAGIVVPVTASDIPQYSKYGVFQNMAFQEEIEKLFYNAQNHNLAAPAQIMTDFVNSKLSRQIYETSYLPGVFSAPIHKLLPDFIVKRMQKAFIAFNNKMKGFLTDEATLIGVESRTSSTIRIPRNNQTLEHVKIKRLFPCGEGAGYAGGIVSSAIDGINAATKIIEQ